MDSNNVLWLALTAKLAGQRPSELADIRDDIAALDFDLACAFRHEIYETEKAKTLAKLIAYEVSKLFGDGSENDDDLPRDQYTDGATQAW
jgi:hypothetical protein